ncbi:MAG: dihydrofolate reductase, partial [Rhodothermales bacterium]|nr:dihydrofolate reductase [Rhodothermales bacterium]
MAGNRPEIVIIAALAQDNRVIGVDKDLPWHIPEDLKRFKQLTTGFPLLMGRKTFESLLHQFGGPLPNRRNVVLTSKSGLGEYEGVETYENIGAALAAVGEAERIFIGGGGNIY